MNGELSNSVRTFPPLKVLRAFTAVYAPVPDTSVRPDSECISIGSKGD